MQLHGCSTPVALRIALLAVPLSLRVHGVVTRTDGRLRSEGSGTDFRADDHGVQAPTTITQPSTAMTFQTWYDSHQSGRGVWKWNNAIVAYTRHFSQYSGHPVNLVEVGVQSGGSIDMWHAVLGASCVVHGVDINSQVLRFTDAHTTITIGDQADVNMWNAFFSARPSVDILIDDGGHEPVQMLVTLQQTLPRINRGGFVVIEDIHGQHYVQNFFRPAAALIAQEAEDGRVDVVHLYPYLLMVQASGVPVSSPRGELVFGGASVPVSSFEQMWASVAWIRTNQPYGGHVVLQNPGWGSFLTQQALINFFEAFGDLHNYQTTDFPAGCAKTAAATCVNTNRNSPLQAAVSGVHIYPSRLVVEVATGNVVISATRRGTEWMTY